jgi:hypothetical protein
VLEALEMTYDLARVFLLLRFSLRTRFFLHFALILTVMTVSVPLNAKHAS